MTDGYQMDEWSRDEAMRRMLFSNWLSDTFKQLDELERMLTPTAKPPLPPSVIGVMDLEPDAASDITT